MAEPQVSRPYLGSAAVPDAAPGPDDPSSNPPAGATGERRRAMPIVRPYLLTGGRTRSEQVDLAIEALVAITEKGRAAVARLTFENHQIAQMCARPISVAEISAHMKVPIGVARVLVSDMVGDGHLETYETRSTARHPAGDTDLVRRLINGVRAL